MEFTPAFGGAGVGVDPLWPDAVARVHFGVSFGKFGIKLLSGILRSPWNMARKGLYG